jgi:hypothetical protein
MVKVPDPKLPAVDSYDYFTTLLPKDLRAKTKARYKRDRDAEGAVRFLCDEFRVRLGRHVEENVAAAVVSVIAIEVGLPKPDAPGPAPPSGPGKNIWD